MCNLDNPDFVATLLLVAALFTVVGFWLGQIVYMDPPNSRGP